MTQNFAAADALQWNAYFLGLEAVFAAQLAVLPDKAEETAAATLAALWCCVQGTPVSVVKAPETALLPLSEEQKVQLTQFMAQRLGGVPLAHLIGRQHFLGLELLASPDALIPRTETEILVKLALDTVQLSNSSELKILDVCTGSGNVALALAAALPHARVFAADLSAQAVQLARRNAEFVGLQSQLEFAAGDLCNPFNEPEHLASFNLITCNPPYIMANNVKKMPKEIADHEPALAFDGGPMGIAIIERIIQEAHPLLREGGYLCLEVGAGQGPFIDKRLKKSGLYQEVKTACDHQGQVRALAARK